MGSPPGVFSPGQSVCRTSFQKAEVSEWEGPRTSHGSRKGHPKALLDPEEVGDGALMALGCLDSL